MKYCIVPDVHGRTFWKKAQENIDKYDKVIFLGDYLDPYVDYDGITNEQAFDNFKELLKFAKDNRDKVTLILGNHDLHYLPNISENYGCRRDNKRYKVIQSLFLKNLNLFSFCSVINTKVLGRVLLSHAGINLGWYLKNLKIVNKDNWEDILNGMVGNVQDINKYIWNIGVMRGGYDSFGGIVWSDLYEHDTESTAIVNQKLGVDYQIFAHTYSIPSPDEIYVCDSYSMIDNKKLYEIE